MTDALLQKTKIFRTAFGRRVFSVSVLAFTFILAAAAFSASSALFAQTQISQPDRETIVIDNAETEVFAFGKTVIVEKKAKGVMAFGGDVIIRGEVEGDVATVGGSVIQKKDAFIGGDVIILGGKYQPEAKNPRRREGRETVMYAGYEEEIRNLTQNPARIFSPSLTFNFLVQRVLSLLFWFAVAFGITSVTPNAVSRHVANFRLSTLKIFGIGALAFTVSTLGVILSFGFLPSFVGALVGIMAFILIMLAYVFGRVILQVAAGKLILKTLQPEKKHSETLTLFTGALAWTILLSIPYLWTAAVFALFTASLGLVLTARSKMKWEKV